MAKTVVCKNEKTLIFSFEIIKLMDTIKRCSSCDLSLPLEQFSVNRRCKDERDTKCKSCHRQYYFEHAEQKRATLAKWREKNPHYQTESRQTSEKRREYEREYYLKNKESYLESMRKQRESSPVRIFQREKEYRFINREKINEYHRHWKNNKRSQNVEYKLRENMSRRIRYELNTVDKTGTKKNKSTLSYMGTSTSNLKTYLESRFEIGMSWQNYGTSWHIDHIIPCAFWEQRNALQSVLCWHYLNLNPLWAFSNKSKKDNVNENRLLYYTTYMKMLLFDL